MNVGYGEWLRDEAERHGRPRLRARPWPTLADRLLPVWWAEAVATGAPDVKS